MAQNVGNVADWACMACVDVRYLPVDGSGTGNCWWLRCGGFGVEVRE